MTNKLNEYKQKRNFKKTKEPSGRVEKRKEKLRFVVQHHLASRDHFDLRLEFDGTLKSWAVPKGPSFNPNDKRLAVEVEDHPLDYRSFEGTIPKGQYGGGTVMIWDEGYWEPLGNPNIDFNKGSIKFSLDGKRLKGKWALVKMEKNNWIFVKDKDSFSKETDIKKFNTSIRTGRTMNEIEMNINKKEVKKTTLSKRLESGDIIIESIKITNPDKTVFAKPKITKEDIALYYQKIASRMLPFLENRIISTIRCPDGTDDDCFFKKHLSEQSIGFGKINLERKSEGKNDFYYITDLSGVIAEVQMNTIEFHTWGSNVKTLEKPDIMVFDLDPDEKMTLNKIRQGVKDLKSILDELNLISFLKTSGGKGYHIVVPFKPAADWEIFKEFARNIAKVMEAKWPDNYTTNVRKINRKGKIFVDWIRNTRTATSVAPYSLRKKKGAPVSMPIKWTELDTIAPNDIKINDALKKLKYKDPWEKFFQINQQIK